MLSHELFCMVSQTGHQIGGVTVSQQPGRGDHQNDGQIILLQTYVYIHIRYTHIYIYICNDACNNFATFYISQFWDGASMSRTLWLLVEATGSPNSSLAAKITVFWDAVHDCAAPPAQP